MTPEDTNCLIKVLEERDAARAEVDKLRRGIERLKTWLRAERKRFPIDGPGKAIAAEIMLTQDRVDCIDANPKLPKEKS